MTDTFATVNHKDIEARARKLRAEATRAGLLAIRRAIANSFASLGLRRTSSA